MIICATTMNKVYYDVIGKIMLKSWKQFFPSNCKLYLYLEDFSIDLKDDRIIICDWEKDIIPLYNKWVDKPPVDNGHRSQKFTKKAMSQMATWDKFPGSKFLWLDADLIFLKSLEEDFFDKILGDYPLASWGDGSFESGTVFINTAHPDWEKIVKIYKEIYFGQQPFPVGKDKNTKYPSGWLDGEILGYAAATSKVRYLNLNYLCKGKTNTPLNHSWLGEYMIHFKASRKEMVENVILNEWGRKDLYQFYIED